MGDAGPTGSAPERTVESFMATSAVVLVVDNEPLIRAITVDAVEDDGFGVLEAATGDYGKRVCEDAVHQTEVQLLRARWNSDRRALVQRRKISRAIGNPQTWAAWAPRIAGLIREVNALAAACKRGRMR